MAGGNKHSLEEMSKPMVGEKENFKLSSKTREKTTTVAISNNSKQMESVLPERQSTRVRKQIKFENGEREINKD